MKFRNQVKRFAGLVPVASVGVLGLSGSAFATVDTAVSTAISNGQTDGVAIAGLVLALIIAIGVFKYMRKGL